MRILSLAMVALALGGCMTGTAEQEPHAPASGPVTGSAASASGSAAPASGSVVARCAGYTDQAARACTATPGCSYGPPIWCSGVAPRDEDVARLKAGPCSCTCQAERADCSERPSALPTLR